MSISLLLEMAMSDPEREALVSNGTRLTVAELSNLADGGAGVIVASGAASVAYVGTGGAMLPLLIFSSARAARTFTPLNYRLSSEGLRELIDRLPEPLVVFDDEYRDMVEGAAVKTVSSADFVAAARIAEPAAEFADPDDVAIVLFTSGTTSRPKAVELSHNNLTSYVMGTVEFASAEPTDAVLICVPPYHIAGVSAALSNL
ncbi:MAG: AMP-binding protein, partial [Candidatus Sericytochromatia bacterium]